MLETNALKILKNAILLEKRGQAFYQNTADQAQGRAVKEFFELMADEEEEHIRILSEQFKSLKNNNKFKARGYLSKDASNLASEVLTREIKEQISGSGFESAAISAAAAMEQKAVELYSQRAETAEDPEEKKLYQWLAQWEQGHLDMLLAMDKELTEKIWNDNQFWPF
ncbi:Rubrerythrin [Desulfonema limicola]|uniref:Rubrerythrin n=1 Tax=Desulfonema limicola TaxID=45656 RepID=A0A975BC44_9BACT|nr:ferritin family protein [Desulfonema limicola]QTA82651.1 Rubrerythrin [Desulfonema limicola]